MNGFIQDLKTEFHGYNGKKFTMDLMAGLTVAAVALPLALAFAVSNGVDAAAGLITSIFAGFFISTLGGGSYQISGPTGTMTAVMLMLVAQYGLQGVFVATMLAGVIRLVCGLLKLGSLVSYLPMPVVTGFTSGIAIVIATGQIDNFFGTVSQGTNTIEKLMSYGRLGFHPDPKAMLIGGIVIAIMLLWPKKWNAKVPSSLVGIIVAAIVSNVLKLDLAVVGEIPRTLLPEARLHFSDLSPELMVSLLPPAFTIAALGMIESLLCGASASRMKNEGFNADRELLAQGIGNILIPFFGGIPATAAIARTSVAIKSGGQTRLAGVFHSAGLLLCMFLLGPVMAKLPLAALAGVLLVTAWRMNEWSSIRYIFHKRFTGAIIKFLLTMVCAVVFDLTIAIIIGVAFAAFSFIAKSTALEMDFAPVRNERMAGEIDVETNRENTIVAYITGALFFGSVAKFNQYMGTLPNHCKEVIFSMRGVTTMDTSGAQTMMETCRDLQKKGVQILFCGVHKNIREVMAQAGIVDMIGEDSFFWSVDKALMETRFVPSQQ